MAKGWIVKTYKVESEAFFETKDGAEMFADGQDRIHGRLTAIEEGEQEDVEPEVVITEDGYKFKRQADGSYGNGDMVFSDYQSLKSVMED